MNEQNERETRLLGLLRRARAVIGRHGFDYDLCEDIDAELATAPEARRVFNETIAEPQRAYLAVLAQAFAKMAAE